MKNISRKLALGFLPFMLLGCSNKAANTVKNFFSADKTVLPYDGSVRVTLSDPRYNYKYSIEFVPDKLKANIVLGGGLTGKEIEAISVSEDLHSVGIYLTGNSTKRSESVGTITIKPGAIKALNSEYSGSTFINTFTVSEMD